MGDGKEQRVGRSERERNVGRGALEMSFAKKTYTRLIREGTTKELSRQG